MSLAPVGWSPLPGCLDGAVGVHCDGTGCGSVAFGLVAAPAYGCEVPEVVCSAGFDGLDVVDFCAVWLLTVLVVEFDVAVSAVRYAVSLVASFDSVTDELPLRCRGSWRRHKVVSPDFDQDLLGCRGRI